MVSYTDILKSLTSYTESPTIKSPVGVFVGGTSGIGLNSALAFARVNVNAPGPTTIYIVGRNKQKAEDIQKQLTEINPSIKFHFLQHDLTYIEQAKRVANTITNNETAINVLFVTQGGLSIGPRDDTSEGVDKRMATSFYTRWQIVSDLVPLLATAAKKNEPARVVTVLAAGMEAKQSDIDTSDFGLDKSYTRTKPLSIGPAYNTLSCLRFARKYPDVAFIHTYPGVVKTGVFREMPWYSKPFLSVVSLFATSPEVAGNKHLYAGLVAPQFKKGAHILKDSLDEVYPEESRNGEALYTIALQDQLWNHTEEVFKKAIASDVSSKK